jgi:hypothetical protein
MVHRPRLHRFTHRFARVFGRVARPLAASPRAALVVLAVAIVGCGPKIGDHCLVSSDCATNGSRVCDTSQPDGYCTVFNCMDDSCPNNAACVVLMPSVPGCPYNDYQTPSRSSRTLCMATCNSDSDCRTDNGYICASPLDAPWRAIILDNNQSEKVCIVAPPEGTPDGGAEDAAICMPEPNMSFADAAPDAPGDGQSLVDVEHAPDVDAPTDAAETGPLVDAPSEAAQPEEDAGTDAALDAAGDAGLDGSIDDAGLDAATDALFDGAEQDVGVDASPADASGGG